MNILLGVYACEPNKGSEPEVGWQMVNEIAKAMPNDKIYAITKKNNQEVIEKEGYASNVTFFYYAPPKWLTFWKKGGRGIRTYYYVWLIGAALFMKKQHLKFDIVHHVTFVNDWLPSYFFLLKNKNNKFIWGPIGSHDPIDAKFLDGTKRKIIEKVRIFLQLFFRNLDPAFHLCKLKSDCVIGINENVKLKLNLSPSKHFIAKPAIGIKKSYMEEMAIRENKENTFIIVSVGRLLYIKNFKLSITAFALFLNDNPTLENVTLKIIGDGVDKQSLLKLVKRLNIEKYVEFTGNIPLERVQENFAQADLFLFPTLENAGFVTLEAMSHALPVVAMKYGGPEQFVKSYTNEQLVDAKQEYDDIAKDLAARLNTFYHKRDLCVEVGRQNREDLLNNFTWEAKAKKMKNIYYEVLNEA